MIDVYNSEIDRWKRAKTPNNIDAFVIRDETKIKWSSRLKETFERRIYAEFDTAKIRSSLYRPFTRKYLFFDPVLTHRQGVFPRIYPAPQCEQENLVVCLSGLGHDVFQCLIANRIVEVKYSNSANGGTQCFPFYIYSKDGTNRRENITDWAVKQFREHYKDKRIGKWDIFYYVYGLLHHPGYREKYADNLKRELPRIPFAPDFRAFSKAGEALAEWHLGYEQATPYELNWVVSEDAPLSYRVEKMRLNKEKTALKVNESLVLDGIPADAYDYRLGNRSALEWVIDQYRVKTDERSGIVSDPNNADDEQYIVRLVGQVVRVSIETVKIVRGLPEGFGG